MNPGNSSTLSNNRHKFFQNQTRPHRPKFIKADDLKEDVNTQKVKRGGRRRPRAKPERQKEPDSRTWKEHVAILQKVGVYPEEIEQKYLKRLR